MTDSPSVLAEKISASKREVRSAELALSRLLEELTGARRADKTTVTEAVQKALAKLRQARVDLEDLSRIVAAND